MVMSQLPAAAVLLLPFALASPQFKDAPRVEPIGQVIVGVGTPGFDYSQTSEAQSFNGGIIVFEFLSDTPHSRLLMPLARL